MLVESSIMAFVVLQPKAKHVTKQNNEVARVFLSNGKTDATRKIRHNKGGVPIEGHLLTHIIERLKLFLMFEYFLHQCEIGFLIFSSSAVNTLKLCKTRDSAPTSF